jgi:hypothetical protein
MPEEAGHSHYYRPQDSIRPSFLQRTFGAWTSRWRTVTVIAGIGIAIGGLLFLVVFLPNIAISDKLGMPISERLKAQNDVRATTLQGLGGLALLVGLYFTARNVFLGQAGLITDRFTKAVEQIGSGNRNVRIGGIYALERIARDSRNYYSVILELALKLVHDTTRTVGPPASRAPIDAQLDPDVQVALTVIGRRKNRGYERKMLDLWGCNLSGADLTDGDWRNVNLYYSNLDKAQLADSNLFRAGLGWACARNAFFSGADMREASVRQARLNNCFFVSTDLRGADLRDAVLDGCFFGGQKDARGKS